MWTGQHVKCTGYPLCTRCQKSGKRCERTEQKWRFRHAVAAVQYVDETPKYTKDTPSNDRPTTRGTASPHTPDSRPSPSQPPPALPSTISPTSIGLPTSPHSRQPSTLQTHRLPWPRFSPRDACLLRYFVEELARWFDLTDPEHHFECVVPQRCRTCPALLDALLAASARHFSTLPPGRRSHILEGYGLLPTQDREMHITEETVIYYHNRSITQLRNLANEPEAIMDENLLAAVVALRFFEELDSLRASAFWVGFRQEFNLAFSQQRSIRLPPDIAVSYLIWTPAPDHVWTNRLIVIGTHVLECCYGDNHKEGEVRRRYEYDDLVQLREKWVAQRPSSFEPVYAEEPRLPVHAFPPSDLALNSPDTTRWDSIFPKIWFTNNAHIVAAQTLGLLDILLTAYSPYIPRVGPSRRTEMEAVDTRIRQIVLDVCGMGLSNRQSPPAALTACIAIIICADWFVDVGRGVQKALMEVVVRTTEENNYWPTGESQVQLRQVWGWN
ncbi:hypothetical protein BJX65DRAFT_321538 [Aspergillus insuetus]